MTDADDTPMDDNALREKLRERLAKRKPKGESELRQAVAQRMPPQEPGFTWRMQGWQCKARSADGSGWRCQRPAAPGMEVCVAHGAASPAARRSARARLADLVDPAIGVLAEIMMNGAKEADRLKAADSLLDRAGVGRVSQVESTVAFELVRERVLRITERGAPEQVALSPGAEDEDATGDES